MRPTRDQWAMELAQITAKRATCLRRQVGAVFLNARGHVLATGYNGVAAGQPHCNEEVVQHHQPIYYVAGAVPASVSITHPHACPGSQAPSGTNLDACQAIHAEQNALLQCRDVYAIEAAFVTASPCITCTKLLLNTSCARIVFGDDYPHAAAGVMWSSAGRIWEKYQG